MPSQRPSQLAWIILLAAFVWLGIRGVAKHFDTRPPRITDAAAGVDQELERLVEVRRGSELFAQIGARIPPDKSVIVAGPGMDFDFCETYFLISYLLWPRPVWSMGQVEPGQVSPFSVMPKQPTTPAAMLFYKIKPPVEMSLLAQPLGPRLSLIMVPESKP